MDRNVNAVCNVKLPYSVLELMTHFIATFRSLSDLSDDKTKIVNSNQARCFFTLFPTRVIQELEVEKFALSYIVINAHDKILQRT